MSRLEYDKCTSKTVDGEKIDYGIVYGNDKIVFIKIGYEGDIQGYKDKYLRIAYRIHDRLGATVICASNPAAEYEAQVDADKESIAQTAVEKELLTYEVYLLGTSDGGYQNLLLAQAVPQSAKLLGINPSLISMDDLVEQLQKIPHVKKILVYGTEDDDFECVSSLRQLDCDNLEILTVEGADHEFTGMVDEFIALTDLL